MSRRPLLAAVLLSLRVPSAAHAATPVVNPRSAPGHRARTR